MGELYLSGNGCGYRPGGLLLYLCHLRILDRLHGVLGCMVDWENRWRYLLRIEISDTFSILQSFSMQLTSLLLGLNSRLLGAWGLS